MQITVVISQYSERYGINSPIPIPTSSAIALLARIPLPMFPPSLILPQPLHIALSGTWEKGNSSTGGFLPLCHALHMSVWLLRNGHSFLLTTAGLLRRNARTSLATRQWYDTAHFL